MSKVAIAAVAAVAGLVGFSIWNFANSDIVDTQVVVHRYESVRIESYYDDYDDYYENYYLLVRNMSTDKLHEYNVNHCNQVRFDPGYEFAIATDIREWAFPVGYRTYIHNESKILEGICV